MDKKNVRIFKNSKSDKKPVPDNINHNKSLDFLNLYKSESETSAILARSKKNNSVITEGSKSASHPHVGPGKVLKKNKKNDTLELSQIDIDGVSLNPAGVTSTPNAFKGKPSVKSIMKNSSAILDDSEAKVPDYSPTGNRKKRNKSVSFRLEDEQDTLVKKSKSETTIDTSKGKSKNKNQKNDATSQHERAENVKKDRTKPRKPKNRKEEEKENNVGNYVMDESVSETTKTTIDVALSKLSASDNNTYISVPENAEKPLQKKKKRAKKSRKDSKSENTDNDGIGNDIDKPSESKPNKKKKRHLKQNENTQATEYVHTNGEPNTKNRKKEVKPEVIANDLENLKIGDNPHTLTDLLDDMTVAEKNKKKNKKSKVKNGKTGKKPEATPNETGDLEKIEEGKEKVVWKKRKWNKDKKSDIVGDSLLTSVIVDNLPVAIMPEYRKVLTDHFTSLGLIKNIGPPEVITNEDEVFTATINFYSEGAATEALQLNNTQLEGAIIRLRRPLPPTETTLVIRSYGALTDQALGDTFAAAGRIRAVKRLIKGKKSMATAFVEFEGPKAVERALKIAEDTRVGGKKIYVSRFDLRRGNRPAVDQPQTAEGKTNGKVNQPQTAEGRTNAKVLVSKSPARKPQGAGAGPVAKDTESSSDSSDED